MEKKCTNCDHMDFCQMYAMLSSMATTLNVNMDPDIAGKTGFVNMVDTMAHDCLRFEKIREDK